MNRKPLGISLISWLAIKTGLARLPKGIGMRHILAVSVLCGIGFTMSIFISSLALHGGAADYSTLSRLGILSGSTMAAVLGYIVLRLSLSSAGLAKVQAAQG